MTNITPYEELDSELKSKLNPQLKQLTDNFFKIDDSKETEKHLTVEAASIDFVEDMLNKPLESELSIETTIDGFKQKVINIYRKILGRAPNNIELMHHSNMLRYEVSTESEIEKILLNSDEYKRKSVPQQTVPLQALHEPITESKPQLEQKTYQLPPEKPDEYYEDIINKAYDEELQRPADDAGIETYKRHMKRGMTEQQLRITLRKSPEYIQNFGVYHEQNITTPYQQIATQITTTSPAQIPSGTAGSNVIHFQMPLNIVYCMMGTNRLHEIKADNYILSILPYVDKFIFIDGGSEDGTVEYLKDLSEKIEVYVHPWQDRFSEQRNNYIQKLKERNYNGWVITSDTDEHYPVESLKQIISIIPEIEKQKFSGIKVQVEDITVDDKDFNKIISRNINQYWKPLIFKFHPNIHYEGEPHETITGQPIKWYKSNIIYEHRRSKLHILSRATENFFVSNSNRYSEKWSDFRFLCTKNNLLTFKDFWNLFKVYKLPKEVENWINSHKDDNQDSGDSEVREMAILYNEVISNQPIGITQKKESDSMYTSTIPEKQEQEIETEKLKNETKEQDTEQSKLTRVAQQLLKENIALRTELNKAIQRIEDLTMSTEKAQPLHELPEEAKKAIHNAITRAFENEDSIYEIVPPDNIYIVRIIKSEADIIENRNGEAIYRKIKLQE